jgi:hypothetical protein
MSNRLTYPDVVQQLKQRKIPPTKEVPLDSDSDSTSESDFAEVNDTSLDDSQDSPQNRFHHSSGSDTSPQPFSPSSFNPKSPMEVANSSSRLYEAVPCDSSASPMF